MTRPGKPVLSSFFQNSSFAWKGLLMTSTKVWQSFSSQFVSMQELQPLTVFHYHAWKLENIFYTVSHIIGYESKQIGWHVADKSSPTVVSLDRFIAHSINLSTSTSKHLRSRDKKLLDKTSTRGSINRTELHSWWYSSDKWWKSCTGTACESLLQSNAPIHFHYFYYKMVSCTPDVWLQVTA